MPLFGSKNKNDTTSTNDTVGGGRHHMQPNSGTQGFPGSSLGPGDYQTGGHVDHGYGGNTGPTNTFAPDSYTQHPTGGHFNNDTTFNSGPGGLAHQGGGRGIPPAGFVNHDVGASTGMGTGPTGASGATGGAGNGGAGQRLTGKVERTIGNLVGSTALQAKGAQKEREAAATKLQGRELAEAERLEQEALMRRERAVGHGAHPANSSLGAGNTGAGTGTGGVGNFY